MSLSSVTRKIKDKHGTVGHYARKFGFDPVTVYRVIAGKSGLLESPNTKSGKIVAQLKKDGFWVER